MAIDRRVFLSGLGATVFARPVGAKAKSPTVFAHGGGIVHEQSYSEMRRLSGGSNTVFVSPYSGSDWQKTFREENYWFNQSGFGAVKLLPLTTIEEFRAAVSSAGIIWFCGGLQSLQMQRLRALSGATAVLKQAYESGVVMAGASAGAAVMSDLMISGGSSGNVNTGRGLGFLPRLVLDQHVVKRHREYRLTKVISANPSLIGVGINEETSVTFQDAQLKVLGLGPVIVTFVQDGVLHETRLKSGDRMNFG